MINLFLYFHFFLIDIDGFFGIYFPNYGVNFMLILIFFVIEIGIGTIPIRKPSLTLAIGRPYAKIFIHFRQIDGDFAGNLVEMRK